MFKTITLIMKHAVINAYHYYWLLLYLQDAYPYTVKLNIRESKYKINTLLVFTLLRYYCCILHVVNKTVLHPFEILRIYTLEVLLSPSHTI